MSWGRPISLPFQILSTQRIGLSQLQQYTTCETQQRQRQRQPSFRRIRTRRCCLTHFLSLHIRPRQEGQNDTITNSDREFKDESYAIWWYQSTPFFSGKTLVDEVDCSASYLSISCSLTQKIFRECGQFVDGRYEQGRLFENFDMDNQSITKNKTIRIHSERPCANTISS